MTHAGTTFPVHLRFIPVDGFGFVHMRKSKCPGSVLDAKGKPKVSEKDDRFASSVNPTRGIKMVLENGNHNSCVVCKHFTVATRHDIRKLVWDKF